MRVPQPGQSNSGLKSLVRGWSRALAVHSMGVCGNTKVTTYLETGDCVQQPPLLTLLAVQKQDEMVTKVF